MDRVFSYFNYLEEAIPLLIIDVNVRPGEKKKIHVYDGDTPLSLTEKFSLENGKKINKFKELMEMLKSSLSN